ncbi:MAG: BON domain-containing protein [Planctomycetota bacterium]
MHAATNITAGANATLKRRSRRRKPISSSRSTNQIMEANAVSVGLLAQVHGALSTSPYVTPGEFSVEASDGIVRLEGAVGSFFQKQMAQELIRRLDGVERIENRLQVNW